MVDQVLPLAHHTQGAVVEDDGDDGDVVVLGGAELVAVHAEAAVAGAVHHHLARIAHGGPMAAPRPKPMVPKPPEVMNWPGREKW